MGFSPSSSDARLYQRAEMNALVCLSVKTEPPSVIQWRVCLRVSVGGCVWVGGSPCLPSREIICVSCGFLSVSASELLLYCTLLTDITPGFLVI